MSSPVLTASPAALATRRFSASDQERFAALSGDYNPMHMDPVAARRMQAGACVVHGVQNLLWALEQIAARTPLARLAGLDADFAQFLYVDEEVSLFLIPRNERELRAELRAGETRIAQYVLKFDDRGAPAPPPAALPGLSYPAAAREALPLDWDAVSTAQGRVAYFTPASAAAEAYPALAAAIGGERIMGLLSLTRLVGMVSPGLHSTFHRITVKLVEDAVPVDELCFSTGRAEPRFALAVMDVRAAGISGAVRASRRQPPAPQPQAREIAPFVKSGAFAGHRALVVGGSRGLGEVAAKLLAMGGAEVVVSYAQGSADAQAVIADIRSAGGEGRACRIDVSEPLAPQLQALPFKPHSVYYFATPRISARAAAAFSPDLLRRFLGIYVDAFHALCLALAGEKDAPVQIFYPSSVFVEDPTKGMAEYAMAKAAGEVLAADITRFTAGLEVEAARLPRLRTDQTASMIEHEFASTLDIMRPIVERVEARVRP